VIDGDTNKMSSAYKIT